MGLTSSDSGIQMMLFHQGECVALWVESLWAQHPQPGQIVPLPESAMKAADWQCQPHALIESCFTPGDLPQPLSELLGGAPASGCTAIVTLGMLPPEVEDGYVLAGTFDDKIARKILHQLEQAQVPFEIEIDEAAMTQAGRSDTLYLIPHSPVPCVNLWVAAEDFGHAQRIVRWVLPLENDPRLFSIPQRPGTPPPAPAPAMEVYTPPSADLHSGQGKGHFLE